jgi:hypothetical protein
MSRLLHAGIALLAGALLLTGCATVRSRQDPTYQAHYQASGLTYFLPMRMLRFTATRMPLRLADLTRAKTQKEAELTRLREEFAAAKTARERLENRLRALPTTTTAENRARVQAELDVARADETSVKMRVEAAEVELANINVSLDALQLGGAACTYSAMLEALPAQADPDQRFVARLSHNILRDDTLKLNVGASGLLTSANIVATDRTADMIVEIAGAIGGSRTGVRGQDDQPATGEPACATLPRQFVHVFDPMRAWVHDTTTPVNQVTLPAVDQLNIALSAAYFPFRVQIDPRALVVVGPERTEGEPRGSQRRLQGEPYFLETEGAIYYRSAVPITFTIQQRMPRAANETANAPYRWQSVDAAVVMLPQAGPVSYIPMNSSAFVRTVNDVQFSDGSITSWSAERPSEGLEVVRLPVRVLTALVSVPAQLLSIRVDVSTRERSLAEMQQQQIEQHERLRLMRECVAAAELQETSTLACFPE